MFPTPFCQARGDIPQSSKRFQSHMSARVTDVPKARRSLGSGCCCCSSMTQGGTMASPSIPQVCRGSRVSPAPVSAAGCRLGGALPCPGVSPGPGELGASSITHARTHAQSHVFSPVNSAGTRQEFHLDQLLNILSPSLETRLPKNPSSQGPSFPV